MNKTEQTDAIVDIDTDDRDVVIETAEARLSGASMTTTKTDSVFTAKTDTLYWACDSCQLPVHGRGGHICLRDGEWFIVHRGCDPDPGNEGHWFPVERAATAMDLLGQTARLHRWGLLAGTNYDTFIHRVLRTSGWEGRP